jgi:hypothetical protein
MKKYTYLLAATAILLFTGSCKKTYTCECDAPFLMGKTYGNVTAANEDKAQGLCAEMNRASVDGPSNCKVLE